MNIFLWILQILLAVLFILHGWFFVTWPKATVDAARKRDPSARLMTLAPGSRRFIGIAEILAAIGLILPSLTGILPWLTPLAALGLVVVMGSAVVYHLTAPKRETGNAIGNLILLILAAVVAYMRWLVLPL